MEAQPTGGAARVELCQVRDSSEALTAGCTYRPCKTLVCLFSGFLWFASAPPCFAHPFSGALGCCCRHHASVTWSPRCPNVSTHVLLHGYVEWDYLMDFSTGKWFLAAPHVTEVTFELFPLVLATLSRCVFTKNWNLQTKLLHFCASVTGATVQTCVSGLQPVTPGAQRDLYSTESSKNKISVMLTHVSLCEFCPGPKEWVNSIQRHSGTHKGC